MLTTLLDFLTAVSQTIVAVTAAGRKVCKAQAGNLALTGLFLAAMAPLFLLLPIAKATILAGLVAGGLVIVKLLVDHQYSAGVSAGRGPEPSCAHRATHQRGRRLVCNDCGPCVDKPPVAVEGDARRLAAGGSPMCRTCFVPTWDTMCPSCGYEVTGWVDYPPVAAQPPAAQPPAATPHPPLCGPGDDKVDQAAVNAALAKCNHTLAVGPTMYLGEWKCGRCGADTDEAGNEL